MTPERKSRIRMAVAVVILIVSCYGCAAWSTTSSTPETTLVGTGKGTPKSENLKRDICLMWDVVPARQSKKWRSSSKEAVQASVRIFNSVNIIGLNRTDVAKAIRLDLRSKDYGYIRPFWPPPANAQVIRIDTGRFGWQFNIVYDSPNGRVIRVERIWIH